MNFGLDFDQTYTEDTVSFDAIISILRNAGHKVYIVSARKPKHSAEIYAMLSSDVDGIYLTDKKAKDKYMKKQGIRIDIWIDNDPIWITKDKS